MKESVNYWVYPSIIKKKYSSAHDDELANSIINTVCSNTGVDKIMIASKTRKREVVEARHIAMFFIKKQTFLSLKKIGLYFGSRDHSTVIHACQTVSDLMECNKKFNDKISMIEYNMCFDK